MQLVPADGAACEDPRRYDGARCVSVQRMQQQNAPLHSCRLREDGERGSALGPWALREL